MTCVVVLFWRSVVSLFNLRAIIYDSNWTQWPASEFCSWCWEGVECCTLHTKKNTCILKKEIWMVTDGKMVRVSPLSFFENNKHSWSPLQKAIWSDLRVWGCLVSFFGSYSSSPLNFHLVYVLFYVRIDFPFSSFSFPSHLSWTPNWQLPGLQSCWDLLWTTSLYKRTAHSHNLLTHK